MKRNFLTAAILGAMVVSSGLLAAHARADARDEKGNAQRAVVQFTEPVKLLNVILKGEYLFVHDEEKMAQGKDCTYIYQQGKLVTSFHCVPVKREAADNFTVLLTSNPSTNLPELIEYRFAGSTEGHQVPQPGPAQ
jgi:hypothetical protein